MTNCHHLGFILPLTLAVQFLGGLERLEEKRDGLLPTLHHITHNMRVKNIDNREDVPAL